MTGPLLHTWNLALGDCFVFVMAAHENLHLGQVSAWRRGPGLGRV